MSDFSESGVLLGGQSALGGRAAGQSLPMSEPLEFLFDHAADLSGAPTPSITRRLGEPRAD